MDANVVHPVGRAELPRVPLTTTRSLVRVSRGMPATLAVDEVAVLVVVPVQLLHRVAEQRTNLVLSVVLSHQLGLLFARAGQNRTHSRRHFRKTRFRCRLRCTRLLRGRVTQLAGVHLTGFLVRAEVHIAVLTHFLLHALNQSHWLNFCHFSANHVSPPVSVEGLKFRFNGGYFL